MQVGVHNHFHIQLQQLLVSGDGSKVICNVKDYLFENALFIRPPEKYPATAPVTAPTINQSGFEPAAKKAIPIPVKPKNITLTKTALLFFFAFTALAGGR